MKQCTIKRPYTFSGKGLHSGLDSTITLFPAPENSGIQFLREDLGDDARVSALIENVVPSSRNTTLKNGETVAMTCEHLLSAMYGLGIDNLLVKMNCAELPILDGSAKEYVQAILADGTTEQSCKKKYITISEPFVYIDTNSDAEIAFHPSDKLEISLVSDYNSKILGIQQVTFTEDTDYATEIAPCRTFCFFHELESLIATGLIKGGNMNNAIVIVENPVDESTMAGISRYFGAEGLKVTSGGYLNNLTLNFPDECGRHKMLDLIGDLYLAGAPLKAKITARKTGHRINAEALKSLLNNIYEK